jgi:hypothetical protein
MHVAHVAPYDLKYNKKLGDRFKFGLGVRISEFGMHTRIHIRAYLVTINMTTRNVY